jgi:hypothetical protein
MKSAFKVVVLVAGAAGLALAVGATSAIAKSSILVDSDSLAAKDGGTKFEELANKDGGAKLELLAAKDGGTKLELLAAKDGGAKLELLAANR